MRYEDAYPVVFVRDLAPTTDFYLHSLGLDVLFESDLGASLSVVSIPAGSSSLT